MTGQSAHVIHLTVDDGSSEGVWDGPALLPLTPPSSWPDAAPPAPVERTLAAGLFWPFVRLVERDGWDDSLLPLDLAALAAPGARVASRLAVRVLSDAVTARRDPTLGLRAGVELDACDLPAIGRAARAERTLGGALAVLA